MRILRVITSADPKSGGPIEGTRRVAEIWARQGHSQDLLTLDPPEEEHLSDYPGRIVALGPPRDGTLLHRYRYSPKMVAWLKAHAPEYDAVIVSGIWRYQSRGAYKGLAGGPTPYFVFTHGMLDPYFREGAPLKHLGKQLSWLWAEGPLLANARRVLFTSAEEQRLAENAFYPYHVKGSVVAYGTRDLVGDTAAQESAFRAHVPLLGKRRYLLFLSRIHHKKGCDLLVEAFAKVAGREPTLDLVVAGPDQVGLVALLKARAEQLGISGRVHFPGMLAGDAKGGAFLGAEAFILPSHQENFGIVVAEALSGSAPALISDKVNIWREIVADGAGLVAPDTLQGTADLLDRWLALPEDGRAAMRERARACFLSRFQIDSAAKSLLELIQSEIE